MASWAQIVPDLDVVTMRTALLFARVTALGHKHVEAAFAEVGLSAGEFDVLASLMHAPDRTSKPSVLARSGMLAPAGMTHRLDLLERADQPRLDLLDLPLAGEEIVDGVGHVVGRGVLQAIDLAGPLPDLAVVQP